MIHSEHTSAPRAKFHSDNRAVLVEEYGWLVTRIARKRTRPGVEFDDLRQEGYLGLLEAIRTWRPDGGATFKAWASLYVLKYVCREAARQRTTETVSMDETIEPELTRHDVVGAPSTTEEDLSEAEARSLLQGVLRRLPASDRELITLTLAGHSQETIGRRLGIGRSMTGERCRLAMGKLERLVQAVAA